MWFARDLIVDGEPVRAGQPVGPFRRRHACVTDDWISKACQCGHVTADRPENAPDEPEATTDPTVASVQIDPAPSIAPPISTRDSEPARKRKR